MSTSDIIQIAISALAAVGIVLNLLLWITTRASLREIQKQNDAFMRSVKNDTISKITASHQSLFLGIIGNPKLLKVLSKGLGPVEVFSENMVATLIINHCAAVHLYALQNTLEPEDWLGIQNDLEDLFSWPIVKERWPQIRTFYSKEFQDLIDIITVKGRRMSMEELANFADIAAKKKK